MMDSNQLAEAKIKYAEAERSTNLKAKSELYFLASKLYLRAVNSVTDDHAKRSLIYLSNMCLSKASSCMSCLDVFTSRRQEDESAAFMLNSERVIQKAHIAKQIRADDIPRRSQATAVQVVRDMLALESALATIGFVNPTKSRSKTLTSAELMRSTFAFNSDLGESFMVLDTKGHKHMTNSSLHLAVNSRGPSAPHGPSHREPPRRPPGPPAVGPSHRQEARPAGGPTKDPRVDPRHLQITRIEIENELNNPLVQSYLSTHAPSPMARSQFDFDNLTQSTISTFNKDTIDNSAGVLNLLQTVRRIGDENAQLLLKIEFLSNLDKQSAVIYKDIENFKVEFTEKFECVRDMLAEFAETSLSLSDTNASSTAVHSDPSAVAVPTPPPSSSILERLGGIIQKELETRRVEVAARTAALAAAEAERVATEKAKAKEIAGARAGGDGGVAAARGATVGAGAGIAGPGQGTGIAEKPDAHGLERVGVRQGQLEKMVKALVARLEKSNKEIEKKNELLDKYVRIINQFQREHPDAKLPALEASTMPTQRTSSVDGPQPGNNISSRASSEAGAGSNDSVGVVDEAEGPTQQSLNLAHAAVVASGAGGVVSTYRKPPSASSPRAAHVADGHGGVLSPTRNGQSSGMPGVPGAAVRTSSGGAAAGMRKSSMLPPRTKHHSTTTLEAMQNAKM